MKCWKLLYIITSCVILMCNADDKTAIERMIQKICNVVKEKLRMHEASPNHRLKILNNIKEKLVKTSQRIGSNSDQIDLIVQGIGKLSDAQSFKIICNDQLENELGVDDTELSDSGRRNLSDNETLDTSVETESTQNNDSYKRSQIKSISEKLAAVIGRSLQHGNNLEEKRENVENAKRHILESFQRHNFKNNMTKPFKNLIAEGIDLTVGKMLANESLRRSLQEIEVVDYDGGIAAEALNESTKITTKVTTTASVVVPQLELIEKDNCEHALQQICIELDHVNLFKCEYDETTLSTQQVCDNQIDCPDGSDEKDCIKQVLSTVSSATRVMSKVESSRGCFNSIADNNLVSHQGQLLYNLLNKQIDFLKKHDNWVPYQTRRSKIDGSTHSADLIDHLAVEVGSVVGTFTKVLNNVLCIKANRTEAKVETNIITKDHEDVLDKVLKEVEEETYIRWSPFLCNCSASTCVNTNCDSSCKRFCYQKYSFGRVACKDVEHKNSVSLDTLCDGKYDCFNKIDETNCAGDSGLSKFEGSNIYDKILRMVKKKMITLDYAPSRNMLVELYAEIKTLQKRSMKHKVNPELVKTARNNCIKLLKMIHTTMSHHIAPAKGESIYEFLFSLHEKLVAAMMRTHIGNIRENTPDECLCRNGSCAQALCTPACEQNCYIRVMITNYICNNSTINITLPLETVCDEKINCPNAEDELNCKNDVCVNSHHAKLLESTIQNADIRDKNSLLADAFDTWKAKALAVLGLEINYQEKLTPKKLRSTVSLILTDLSLTLNSLENFKNVDGVLQKFIKVAQRIIELLKNCNK